MLLEKQTTNMELWFIIILTACLAILLRAFISLNSKSKSKFPPRPRSLPIISNILWLMTPSLELEASLRSLRSKFGSIVTLPIGPRPVTFISSRALAYQALVQNGAVFADRPEPSPTVKIMRRHQHLNISSTGYNSIWRLLRRNLTSQILHPSRLKHFSPARKWVLDILLNSLSLASKNNNIGVVKLMDHFRFSMFCLLVFMCFGDKLEESKIKEIEDIQVKLLVSSSRFKILDFLPWLSKFVFRRRWDELLKLRKIQEGVLIPLIRERKLYNGGDESRRLVTCYVDTLLSLELEDQDSKRKLSEIEIGSACSEILNAGTDTTSTSLQWIMANIVKYPDIQAKLFREIRGVIGADAKQVEEDQLSKMPYLKAVILEGLRRHPPGHFVLPHAVTQDTELGGYTFTKNMDINFMVAEMGWDPEVWEDPMQFKPERFMLNTGDCEPFDITGNRGIKMMPFGAGRRICPGYGLAILHLEYFVANLIWKFEWAPVDGQEVDLSEKQESMVVMKHPLHAHIFPRQANK